jgi:hypothetical protein
VVEILEHFKFVRMVSVKFVCGRSRQSNHPLDAADHPIDGALV